MPATPVALKTDLVTRARWYADNPLDWPLVPRFNAKRRWYHRLAGDDEAEAWLLTWLPGQHTDLHDHGGSAGAFVVVSGTLTEQTVSNSPRRLLTATLNEGRARPFGPRHIHRIVNDGAEPAISVHVYSPALREMTRYRLEHDRLIVVGVDQAGTDW